MWIYTNIWSIKTDREQLGHSPHVLQKPTWLDLDFKKTFAVSQEELCVLAAVADHHGQEQRRLSRL